MFAEIEKEVVQVLFPLFFPNYQLPESNVSQSSEKRKWYFTLGDFLFWCKLGSARFSSRFKTKTVSNVQRSYISYKFSVADTVYYFICPLLEWN